MSLSRLWYGQGKLAEARQLLTEVYGWFTEGFAIADLQEAKTWLRICTNGSLPRHGISRRGKSTSCRWLSCGVSARVEWKVSAVSL